MTIIAHKTASENGPFQPFTFTGKERDAETGYSYFGARYYDSDLSGLFLCVDPMSDKYPSITPYAYCAWNPMKLVDPDGRDVILSESAQKIHNIYYGKEEYKEYTDLYDRLNKDHSILINVKECNDNSYAKSIGANGIVVPSLLQQDRFPNGCFDVEWGVPDENYGGSEEHVFLEEFFHAGQMKKASYDLDAAYSIASVYSAKSFALAISPSYKSTFDDYKNGVFGIPTELHIINTYEYSKAKEYLKYGIEVPAKDRFNNDVMYKTGGHYEKFPWD